MSGLSIEQMEFLIAKGLSGEDMLAFAKMSAKPKSKGAERIARWRAKQKGGIVTDGVTSNVTCNALPPPIEDHTPPVSSNDETTPRRKSKRSEAIPAKPEGVQDCTWAGFVALRKQKRAPITQSALDGIEAEAAKAGWSMEAALAKCNTRGWQGFEAEWVAGKPAAPPGGSSDYLAGMLAKQAANA